MNPFQMTQIPRCYFSYESSFGTKKITAKTLCEITGTKYYPHNEEIEVGENKIMRVYDENDSLIGDLTF